MVDMPRSNPSTARSGSLLLRVWCEGQGEQMRVIARLLEWSSTGDAVPAPPEYASGIEEIVVTVRRWLTEFTGESPRV